ncbi:AAA family ATPase [Candidatus Woesearchaeota archaeon]|nr:AAA family ATPase [Candidatus Woesearchaeota archaeon]
MDPFFIYKPKQLSEIDGQDHAVKTIGSFFSNFKKGKGLFLFGPPGVGKTASIYAFAKENNYEVLELNASDTRSASGLKDFLSRATGQTSLFATKKLILLDEVDGLSGTKDRGASSVIADFMKSSTFPIVAIGVDVFDKKFSAIKKVSATVEFSSLKSSDIFNILKSACLRAKIDVDEKDLKSIARNSNGDARAALNDLFSFVIISDSKTDDTDIRKQTEEISDVLFRVFKSTDPDVAFGTFDNVNDDLDKIFLWVDQNLPYEYVGSSDLSRAYDVLALADRFFGRIRRWQYYRYYAYCYLLLSVGVALSKDQKSNFPPKYKQPSRLLKYWQANMTYAKRKSIVEKIANSTRVSKRVALQSSFHCLLPALANDVSLQEELEIDSDELAWIKKQV